METESKGSRVRTSMYHFSEKARNFVYVKKDFKDFLGESILIIFSVFLALIVTEFINKLHEKDKTRSLLNNIVAELRRNEKSISEMKAYNLLVLNKIDSALADKKMQDAIVSNDEFNLKVIAPEGVLYRYLDNVAWTIAKDNDIMSRINLETIAILTRVYDDQDRIGKVEDEVADVILNRASRDPKQIHATLILIRDNYHGWAVDRIPGLLKLIDQAINDIEKNTAITSATRKK